MSDNGVFKDSKLFSLNKSTYVNLRWIAYTGQIITILIVQFILEYNFSYLICISIVFFSILTNINLQFKIQENQLNNTTSSIYLSYDILQLGVLFFFTGVITNPFITTTYPGAITNAGFSLRFTLAG